MLKVFVIIKIRFYQIYLVNLIINIQHIRRKCFIVMGYYAIAVVLDGRQLQEMAGNFLPKKVPPDVILTAEVLSWADQRRPIGLRNRRYFRSSHCLILFTFER